MDSFVPMLLIGMFFLGAAQLLWALIHAATSKYLEIRKHFLYYFIGVGVYFIILATLANVIDHSSESIFFIIHFFGGAGTLALYHVWIVIHSLRLGESKHEVIPSEMI